MGAALRLSSLEAGTPRPLDAIAAEFGTTRKVLQKKFSRITHETAIGDELDETDLIVQPAEYVPYLSSKLKIDDSDVLATVREALETAQTHGGTSPLSEVAAAFYAVVTQTDGISATQREVAAAAGLTEVTVRNNYPKFSKLL